MHYTATERRWLLTLACAAFTGLNGVFAWAVVAKPESILSALRNPVAAAFIGEAFVLVGVLAYFLGRWGVSRVHWAWFVLLALVGGIAFALPVALLWRGREADDARVGVRPRTSGV